ncbi:mono-functional DNA-alkylating methyl methanesulfonate N-term-domain-containing protein [Lophiotrema nucula]|uniref:Mono-functional DNA-alkylating methyl methanesulfonate N-term-domain-containing protein n=1 Tax=Lophiotrema nucula TaxID=690887 RepID=A0A6A5ZTJ3_9PLEO|nr:mono-functional DNA-alkylating methyl methanesulfonate N-term-domain-containing protein [Lophiotrema nucula]
MENNQILGQVLIDGEWVSRPADVYQIMDRARHQQGVDMQEPDRKASTQVPKLGLLSRTLISSPAVKLILRANIRQRNQNDVVFIGEDFVHLKEVRAYGHLRQIATKSDFSGRILAVRVFGEPRFLQTHSRPSGLFERTAVQAQRRSHLTDEGNALPSEVLVLSQTTRDLTFLWAESIGLNTRFSQKSVKLPGGSTRYTAPGPHIATDPKCRAIAVGAYEGCFVWYKTKTLEQWCNEGCAGTPIEDERLIPVQGSILHMAFLSPGINKADEYHVILLLVLVRNGKTQLSCYDWDCRQNLNAVTARADRVHVDFDDRLPSLLVPLNRSSDFFLVCDRHIAVYRNILSGTRTRFLTPITESAVETLRPGQSKTHPRWVQWDKVTRNPDFSKEAFYIVREDGRVLYTELGSTGGDAATINAGQWPHPLDKAFASLDVDVPELALANPDVLLAAGTASDGQLNKVGSWISEYRPDISYADNNSFSYVESIPNWGPISDLAVLRLPGIKENLEWDRKAIVIANGRAPFGNISELRRGFNAQIGGIVAGFAGCTRLSIVRHAIYTTRMHDGAVKESWRHATLIVTMPPESFVVQVSRTEEKTGDARSPGSWDFKPITDTPHEINCDAETISACILDDKYALQITSEDVRLLRLEDLQIAAHRLFTPTRALAATAKPGISFVAIILPQPNQQYLLQVLQILYPGEENGQIAFGGDMEYVFESDPTCVELLGIAGESYVLIGLRDTSIWLFRIERTETESSSSQFHLELISREHCQDGIGLGLPTVCETAVALVNGSQAYIVYGMRDGVLFTCKMDFSRTTGVTTSRYVWRMGTTAVHVKQSRIDPSIAFVSCGQELCRIRLPAGEPSIVEIDSIWFTSPEDPSYQQGPVTAIDQAAGASNDDQDPGGFIFAVSGDKLLFAQLDYDIRWSRNDIPPAIPEASKTVTRKYSLIATPTRVLHLEHMKKLVVATIEPVEVRSPPHGYRAVKSRIKLLRLDNEPEVKLEPEETNKLVFDLKSYERVNSMLEWSIENKGKYYHYIVVGTGITQGAGNETGRRLFLQYSETKGVRSQKETSYHQPVRCMALFGKDGLVMIVGKTLSFDEYDRAAAKWIKRGSRELPSAGVHLTTSNTAVYVSTAKDSHMCFQVITENAGSSRTVHFDQIFTDQRQRDCLYHMSISVEAPTSDPTASNRSLLAEPSAWLPVVANIVLLTDKACSVTGLYQPAVGTHKVASDTLFEASLPRSITRLQRGDIRPPWRRPCRGGDNSLAPRTTTGILVDDIIGSCSDGTIYTISILSLKATRVLKLMQNLIEVRARRSHRELEHTTTVDTKDIRAHSGIFGDSASAAPPVQITGREIDPRLHEKGRARPRNMHVDGDVLTRFFESCDGDDDWRNLWLENTDRSVHDLTQELVEDLLEQHDGVDMDGKSGSLMDRVKVWLDEVLMPVL